MKNSKKITIEIEKIVTGGYGLAHHKNDTYMVRGALEGEIVNIEPVCRKKNVIFATTDEVLKPSDDRVDSFCPYYGMCGGCVFQHMSYQKQIETKVALTKEILQRNADTVEPVVNKIFSSPQRHNYRKTAAFRVQDGKIGFFKENSHDLVQVRDCMIIDNSINDIIPRLEELARKYPTTIEINCIYSPYKNDLVLNVITSNKINNPGFIDKLLHRQRIKGITFMKQSDRKIYLRRGSDSTVFAENRYRFRVHSAAFMQNNLSVYDAFYSSVSQYLTRDDNAYAIDIYSGTGFFTLLLAEYFNTVVSVESDYYSYRNALKNRNDNGFKNIHAVNTSIEDPQLKEKIPLKEACHFNTALIDPPRNGLSQEAVDKIKSFLPETLIYVSCEPSTLARDINRLRPQYKFIETNIIDSFPHTKHIETVSLFKLDPSRPREKLSIKTSVKSNIYQ